MDYSGDEHYDDDVTSGRYDDDPSPYNGTLSDDGDTVESGHETEVEGILADIGPQDDE